MKDMLGVTIRVGDIVANTAVNQKSYDFGKVIGFSPKKVKVQVLKEVWYPSNDRISYANAESLVISVLSGRP